MLSYVTIWETHDIDCMAILLPSTAFYGGLHDYSHVYHQRCCVGCPISLFNHTCLCCKVSYVLLETVS